MSAFRITKHYEVFVVADIPRIREIEVVERDGKIFRWKSEDGILLPLDNDHCETVGAAYEKWRKTTQELHGHHLREECCLEHQLEVDPRRIIIVQEEATP